MIRRAVFPRHLALCALFMLVAFASAAVAGRIILKDGTVLEGDVGRLGTFVANPNEGRDPGPGGRLIIFVDNHVRKFYTSLHNVREVNENVGNVVTEFTIRQPVASGGRSVDVIGQVSKTTPWDEHGRRTMTLLLKSGAADVIQGITKITPSYFRVQTLNAGQRLLLDQRYAITNLPTPLLRKILYNSVGPKKNVPDSRLRIYRFFLESDRYADAEVELRSIVKDFPQLDLEGQLAAVRNLKAGLGLRELRYRREAGQHQLATNILANFPSEDIAGETLLEVREILEAYRAIESRIKKLRTDLQAHQSAIRDVNLRGQLDAIVAEMIEEVNSHTLVRFAPYLKFGSDQDLTVSEKLALAISGWLVGTDAATDNLPVAKSLVEVRALVQAYLVEESKLRREEMITRIRSQEGGIPRYVAKILAHMKPPLPLPEPLEEIPGFFQVGVASRPNLPDVSYLVQLPPEYDPYRRYPVIITLHGAGTSAAQQIDWWAGGISSKSRERRGQGTRHGYIVIAPQWAKVKQQKYAYSGREHAAVLDTYRDACRRFAIDTDKVFLSGHSMGGDAAWDIGLSHPDIWAGVIPIVAMADSNRFSYNALYWRNARNVPFFFVGGEKDGAKLVRNAYQFDRYLNSVGYDVVISNFIGRGHESFSDEILNLFDWMKRKRRDFFPKKFDAWTIRSFDNYFWWVEIEDFPKNVVADPENWPPRRIKAMKVDGVVRETDTATIIRVNAGNTSTTVWLSPELIDFDKRLQVIIDRRAIRDPRPDISVMLEDARTRGDRLHPFWARVDVER